MENAVVHPNPIAALIRQGAEDAGRRQGTSRATTKVQRMINSLQWRQAHSKDEFYPLTLDSGAVLKLRQLQAGEVTGLGTGATVWPAAYVLAKYLERRFGQGGMKGSRVVDLGSGTGVAGIVAAALGAEAFLTDQEQLLFLMRENAALCTLGTAKGAAEDAGETAPTTAAPTSHAVHVLTYDWGMDDGALSPPVDFILVSDCVLPKLYPIEPLVEAIDRLSGPDTVTIMSYEHRHYQAFDPRRKFEELAVARGLVKVSVPQAQQHPIFSAEDIEIWEVRRQDRGRTGCTSGETAPNSTASNAGREAMPVDMVGTEAAAGVSIYTQLQGSSGDEPARGVPTESATLQLSVGMLGERHSLEQTPTGAIGCYLWPSAVVMARHIVASQASGLAGCASTRSVVPLYPPCARVLELGSGVGLVAMAAALLGWEVVATDKADALPLLESNVRRCLSSTQRPDIGAVEVVEYEWGKDAGNLLVERSHSYNGYHVVMCADCVYARTSIEPLLATLYQVCDESTIVLVTNELRSAFDEFVQRARRGFEVEDIPVLEDQIVIDTTSNRLPKPVALKRLRRRLLPTPTEGHA